MFYFSTKEIKQNHMVPGHINNDTMTMTFFAKKTFAHLIWSDIKVQEPITCYYTTASNLRN